MGNGCQTLDTSCAGWKVKTCVYTSCCGKGMLICKMNHLNSEHIFVPLFGDFALRLLSLNDEPFKAVLAFDSCSIKL